MSNRVQQLEQSLLELGTEVYRLKHQLANIGELHDKFKETMKALRQVLDDKGVITTEDFDEAVDLSAINFPDTKLNSETNATSHERLKKVIN